MADSFTFHIFIPNGLVQITEVNAVAILVEPDATWAWQQECLKSYDLLDVSLDYVSFGRCFNVFNQLVFKGLTKTEWFTYSKSILYLESSITANQQDIGLVYLALLNI